MKRDDAKTRLIQAAGPIFAEKGYDGATVREICEAAGMNGASVNYYFGGKEPLYIETFHRALPVRDLRRGSSSTGEKPKSAQERLYSVIRHLVQGTSTFRQTDGPDAWRWRLLARERVWPTEACRQAIRDHFRREFDILLEVISGLVPPEMSRARVTRIALSVMGQCMQYGPGHMLVEAVVDSAMWAEEFSTSEITDHIWQMTLAALGQAAPITIDLSDLGIEPTNAPASEAEEMSLQAAGRGHE